MACLSDTAISSLCTANMKEWFEQSFPDLITRFGVNPYSEYGMVHPFNPANLDDIAIELCIDKVVELICPEVEKEQVVPLQLLTYQAGHLQDVISGVKLDLRQLTENTKAGRTHRLRIPANSCVLASSAERVQLPPNAYGHLSVRSSYARQFLNHINSNIIQPTFCGDITFEFYTLSRAVDIKLNEPVVKMLLHTSNVPETPYYARKSSKYMHQNNQLHSLLDMAAAGR